jgi:hypothetical protein
VVGRLFFGTCPACNCTFRLSACHVIEEKPADKS